MKLQTWRSNRPRKIDPTRPARIIARRVVTVGSQVTAPTYEARIVCDDGKVRTFVSGAEGRWELRR